MPKTKTKKKTSKKKGARKKAPKGKAGKKSPEFRGTRDEAYDFVRQQHQDAQQRYGTMFWKPQKGINFFRPVPYEREDGSQGLFIESLVHWNVDPSKKVSSVNCPGKECPICQSKDAFPQKIWEGGKTNSGLRRQRAFLYNGMAQSPEDEDLQFRLCQLPKTVHENVLANIIEIDNEAGISPQFKDMLDLKKGHNFKILRKGSGFQTKYSVSVLPKPSVIVLPKEPTDLDAWWEKGLMEPDELQALAENLVRLHGKGRKR